jgi:pyridoxal/pyridoxine/pyridoxamine kinase
VGSVAEAVAAAGELHATGAREVVVKGLVLDHDGRPTQHVVGLDDDGAWLARAPHVARFWSGSGDVFTALVAGLRLTGIPLAETVARATALMEQLIARTHELDSPELRMVEIDWAAEPAGAHAVRIA